MNRLSFVEHLINQGCAEKSAYYDPIIGSLFVNVINGLECIVPSEDYIRSLMAVHICTVLKVAPPEELEDLYHVHSNFVKYISEEELKEE